MDSYRRFKEAVGVKNVLRSVNCTSEELMVHLSRVDFQSLLVLSLQHLTPSTAYSCDESLRLVDDSDNSRFLIRFADLS